MSKVDDPKSQMEWEEILSGWEHEHQPLGHSLLFTYASFCLSFKLDDDDAYFPELSGEVFSTVQVTEVCILKMMKNENRYKKPQF